MTDIESAVDMFRSGCACSQAILVIYCEHYGLDPDLALKLTAGFGGGMRPGETCGAVTGAFMLLGLTLSVDDCYSDAGHDKINTLIREFAARFVQSRGSISCRDLLGCDVSTPTGLKEAEDRNLSQTICAGLVRDAAGILENLLADTETSATTGSMSAG
ncbi:C_GCAxxG_C_C family protein [bacterium]|nr:C_GCAxxG_C_C family protein [bacterium]